MIFKRTVLPGGRIHIEDNDGRIVSIKYIDKCVRILCAPVTTELLEAVEADAIRSGKDEICFDFPSELTVVASHFKDRGYELKDSVKILSVKAKELFGSKGVMKSLDVSFPVNSYIPFRDLLLYQVEEMIQILKENGINLDTIDIDRIDDDLSCIVYDSDMNIKSVILASAQGKEILVELLFGVVKDNPQYIMAALQGFAREFVNFGLMDVYDTISMLEVNSAISSLIKRLLDKEYSMDDSRTVICATKSLKGVSYDGDADFEDVSYDPSFEMPMSYPYQDNINWKMQWKKSGN